MKRKMHVLHIDYINNPISCLRMNNNSFVSIPHFVKRYSPFSTVCCICLNGGYGIGMDNGKE